MNQLLSLGPGLSARKGPRGPGPCPVRFLNLEECFLLCRQLHETKVRGCPIRKSSVTWKWSQGRELAGINRSLYGDGSQHSSFPQMNKVPQWKGPCQVCHTLQVPTKNVLSLSDPREVMTPFCPFWLKFLRGGKAGSGRSLPLVSLESPASSLPLFLPCCLFCPSDKPEPRGALSAWNILSKKPGSGTWLWSPSTS